MSLDSFGDDPDDPGKGYSGADVSAAESGGKPAGMSQSDADAFRGGAIAAGAGVKDTDTQGAKNEAKEIQKAVEKRKKEAKAAITKEEKKEARRNYKKIQQRLQKDRIRRQERLKGIFSGAEQFTYIDPITGKPVTEDLNPGGLTDTELADMKAFGLSPKDNIGLGTSDYQGGVDQDLVNQFLEKSDKFSGAEMEAFKEKFNSPDLPGVLGMGLKLFEGPLKKGSRKTKDFFTDDVLGAGKFTYKGQTVTPEMFQFLSPTEMQEVYGNYMDRRMGGDIDAYGNPMMKQDDGGPNQQMDPCKGPNPPAYCFVDPPSDPTDPSTPSTGVFAGIAPRFAGSIFDFDALRAGAMDGGIMNNQVMGGMADGNIDEAGRQMYFLGKLVKKATRAVKKVVKSPFGKAALLGAGAYFMPGFGIKATGGFSNFMKPGGFLSKILTKGGDKALSFDNLSMGKATALGLGIPFALDALGVGKDDDDKMDLDEYYRTQGINVADIRLNPYNYLAPRFAADGGLMRMGYQEGGDAEPVAKKTMPLIDMDGQEKDYRETGGFVDMGRMERADDVPARLSKNEFVFTADAVRNAGEGDIDKGAEVMYNMMKNLEAGGEVSEESQGLEGAKEMFKTSQRLEEVL